MQSTLFTLALTVLIGCNIENDLGVPEKNYPSVWEDPPERDNPWAEDRFHEQALQPVDIMFVIDPSCSMWDNVADIQSNIPTFFDVLDDYRVDYHLGVVSTHAEAAFGDSGELTSFFGYDYIDTQTPNRVSIFSGMANYINGYLERGIDATYTALSPQFAFSHNRDFFRRGAPLHIVLISDEEDQSIEVSPKELVQRLREVELAKDGKVTFSTITHVPKTFNGPKSCASSGESLGRKYMYVAYKTEGLSLDICRKDWSLILEEIAIYSTPPPRYEFFLTQLPVVETDSNGYPYLPNAEILVDRNGAFIDLSDPLHLDENGEEVGDYFYDHVRNSITLIEFEKEKNDVVLVNYEVDSL